MFHYLLIFRFMLKLFSLIFSYLSFTFHNFSRG